MAQEQSPFVVVKQSFKQRDHKHSEQALTRDVYVYVNIFSISEISTASETFQAHFYLRATWIEPGCRRGQELDKSTWQPQILIMNTVAEPEITEEDFREVSWRQGRDGSAVLGWRAKYRACFKQRFELRSFPFDTQILAMTFTTQQFNVRLIEDCYDGSCSILRQEYTILPEFSILGPIFVPHEELALGKYPLLDISLIASRRGSYYIWNLYVPLFILTAMLFSVFSVSVAEVSDRLSLTLTIVLASVAYKYIVSQDLPHIAYLTMADVYVLGNFIFTALVVLENAWAGWIATVNEEDGTTFDGMSLKILFLVFIGGNLAYIAGVWFFSRCIFKAAYLEDEQLSDDADE